MTEMFHTSTGEASKDRILRLFTKPESTIRCLVATVALGMGIHIPDVDLVVHYGCPTNVINYWQEVGRGARDGRNGYAILLWDRFTMKAKNTTKEMAYICEVKDCIRHQILSNFAGSEATSSAGFKKCCAGCTVDRCLCAACSCCETCRQLCPCQTGKPFTMQTFLGISS